MSRTVRLSLLLLCASALTACTRAPVAQSQTQPALASVNGQPIYEEDLKPFIKQELEELKRQEYNLKVKALDRAIEQKILALEADKKKTTVDRLLAAEVDSKVSDPTDSQILAYYQSQQDSLKVPLDQIRPQISQLLKQISLNQARQGYVAELRQQVVVSSSLSAPRASVEPDPARMKGNAEAPVTIVEFSDYQCPYCRQAEPTVKKILEEYGDRIRFSYRDVPLANIHPRAAPAAEAARCAGDQGRFWLYHDLLFKDPPQLEDSNLMEYARTLQLDVRRFRSCLDSGKFRQQVQADYDEGMRAGVNGTPTFFINGVVMSGAQPLNEFKTVIDRELGAATAQNVKSK